MKPPSAARYADSLSKALERCLRGIGACRVKSIDCVIGEEEINEARLPPRVKRPDAIVIVSLECRSRIYRIGFVIEHVGGKRGQPKDVAQASSFEAARLLAREKCSLEASLYIPVLHMHGPLVAATKRPPVRVSCDTSVNEANIRVLRGWLRGFLSAGTASR